MLCGQLYTCSTMQLDAGVVKDEGVKFSVILSESGTYIPLRNVFQYYYILHVTSVHSICRLFWMAKCM